MTKTSIKNKNLDKLRHSTSHLLAASVVKLYPKAKSTLGPPVENGFYYDFDNLTISEDDLPKIEAEMNKIVKGWGKFEKEVVSPEKAKSVFKGNQYKAELIDEHAGKGEDISLYKSGEFTDLCGGGHIINPSKEIKHFKLLSIAGAYWRGDEKNKMLTRIYGTAFPTKNELDDHLKNLEEAKKRDHRKLGKEMNLFMFHETSPGMPYWLPKGLLIYNELIKYWRDEHLKHNYQEIASPLINKSELYITSGHWDHYKDDMFIADLGDNEIYGVKPMNCPNAMLVFANNIRSYKDLPLRLSDTDRLHRYERSGTLSGLFRVRSFQQDDSHNYVSEDMIESEYNHIFSLADKFYSIFGLKYKLRLSTQPGSFLGTNKDWSKAVDILKNILKNSGREFFIQEGEGAFYGPKADILMNDTLGREWQMGTVQLDFLQPQRFKLKYIDKNGENKVPIAIHRVIYGSIERFIGILIEHFAGAFPVWLSPVQVKVLPITERHLKYANEVMKKLRNEEIRVEVNDTNETLQAKIRNAQLEKIPYMLVVGDKEEKAKNVAVRLRSGKDLGQIKLQKFIKNIKDKIDNKSLTL